MIEPERPTQIGYHRWVARIWPWTSAAGPFVVVSSVLAPVGCGPSDGESEVDLPGELLVYEVSADDETASDTLSIIRPDRTRQRVPIEPLRWETAEAKWGLHGDVVLAVDGDLDVWT